MTPGRPSAARRSRLGTVSAAALGIALWFGCSSAEDPPPTNSVASTETGTTGTGSTLTASSTTTSTTNNVGSTGVSVADSTSSVGTTASGSATTGLVGTASQTAGSGQGGATSTSSTSSGTDQGTTGLVGLGGSSTTGQGGIGGSTTTGQATSATMAAEATSTSASATTGASIDVVPSPGCNGGNPSPSLDLPNTIVTLPAGYDGSTPVPVVMAFHAAGNLNTQLEDRFGDDLGGKYLMLYPGSDGNGWNDAVDAPKVDAMFTALTNSACIDENRVFATGHSSGAQFIVQRLCAGETRFRAVAPVASSVYCSSWDPVPALVIHGIGDQERSWDPNGDDDIVPYRSSNGCAATSTEFPVDSCASGGVQVDPGCVQFDGCSERTLWCQHDDPQYGTSHHGIPCFADSLIPQFFDSF